MSLQSNFSACHSGHTKLTSWPFEFTLVNFETRGYYRWRLQNLNQKVHAQITSTHTARPEKDWNSKLLNLLKVCYF